MPSATRREPRHNGCNHDRPIDRSTDEFDRLREEPGRARRGARIVETRARAAVVRVDRTDPSKNIVRGFRAFALLLERHPELARRVGDARAARSVAAGPAAVRGVPRRDRARGACGQRALRRRRLAAGRPPDRRQLPAGRRGLQAVRRAAREPDLRRHEPRREGGAGRERARRCRCPLRERRSARGARRLGAHASTLRRRGPGRGAARGADDARRTSARRRAEALAAYVREHDIEAWTDAQLADLDRPASTILSP